MMKVVEAQACVVRAFLNDPLVWKDVYMEDEEYVVAGQSRIDLESVADTELVTIRGGDVYRRGGTQARDGLLVEHFERWLNATVSFVLVKTEKNRQAELIALLAQHGFDFEVASRS